MGLDMYIYKTTKDRIELDDNLLVTSFNRYEGKISDSLKVELEEDDFDEEDFDEELNKAYEEFFYWRKHPAIHNWMEELYVQRGGKETFNGIFLYLSKEDLKNLKKDIVKKKLNYEATGFFFGKSLNPHTQEGLSQLKRDLEFVNLSLQEIKNNSNVTFIYDSSWWINMINILIVFIYFITGLIFSTLWLHFDKNVEADSHFILLFLMVFLYPLLIPILLIKKFI